MGNCTSSGTRVLSQEVKEPPKWVKADDLDERLQKTLGQRGVLLKKLKSTPGWEKKFLMPALANRNTRQRQYKKAIQRIRELMECEDIQEFSAAVTWAIECLDQLVQAEEQLALRARVVHIVQHRC
jgi:hypothetical protein